jgi:hypothetical protein
MKDYKYLKILAIFCYMFLFFGCSSEPRQSKPTIKFTSVSQSEWNESGKNFYLINLSMRRIDSLSAELNLKFTRKNALGL